MSLPIEKQRSLARIVTIDGVGPIEGADAIEVAQVGGWRVVVKKNEFAPGDLAVYFEIDAFLPEGNPAWQFLVDKSSRLLDEQRGHPLRSVRLRGQISQGLLLSPAALGLQDDAVLVPGLDVSERLGVRKYELPAPAWLDGLALGPFPTAVPKSQQERIQNLAAELRDWRAGAWAWEVTEKLEGTSCTFAWLDGVLHVCSRNLDLANSAGNSLWAAAHALDLQSQLARRFSGHDVALQGELIGHGIQGNIYGLNQQQFFLYDVYDVREGRYLPGPARQALAAELKIQHVPVVDPNFVLTAETDIQALLSMADGASVLRPAQRREGLVFKALHAQASFKAISNQYLLKQKD